MDEFTEQAIAALKRSGNTEVLHLSHFSVKRRKTNMRMITRSTLRSVTEDQTRLRAITRVLFEPATAGAPRERRTMICKGR